MRIKHPFMSAPSYSQLMRSQIVKDALPALLIKANQPREPKP